MKNQFHLIAALTVLLSVSLGCGLIGRTNESSSGSNGQGSNKTLTDKAVDTAVGGSKIGVPECDEVINAITAELNNSEDNFMVKAAKATALNAIKDSIRQSVEENKSDTAELAKLCREYKTQFDRYKAEENSNAQ